MDMDAAFAAVSHCFPSVAEFQGIHFNFASRDGVTLIESKKTIFEPRGSCHICGQKRGEKHTRFYYWLIADGEKWLIHASKEPKFSRMRTIGESLKPSANYLPTTG